MSDVTLRGAAAANRGIVAAPGATVTAPDGVAGGFAWVMPLFGDADISAHDGSEITNLPATFTLSQDVDYPFHFTTVTVSGASVGSLFCAFQPLK